MLAKAPSPTAPLPLDYLKITDYADPMASAMTPKLEPYWDEAGKRTRLNLGLDPDEWRVVDPHLHAMISGQAHDFCASTLATTTDTVADAYARLRQEFLDGLVTEGETIPQLAKRVRTIFTELSKDHATLIARTEASRAVNRASLQSAIESKVVSAKRWLASQNSCDRCLELQRRTAEHPVPLETPFLTGQSDKPAYADIPSAPLHPRCRCTHILVLTTEYAAIVDANPPATWNPGPMGPEPTAKPKPEPVPGATPEIREAHRKQRAENRAFAEKTPIITEAVESREARDFNNSIRFAREQIAATEKAMEDHKGEWEKLSAEWDKAVGKKNDWALTKQTRAKWAKKVSELKPKYDVLSDLFLTGPGRIKYWTKEVADYEKKLAETLAKPQAVKEIRYADNQKRHPDLIPPGPIADRLKAYQVGDAKVAEIIKVGAEHELLNLKYANERRDLNHAIVARMDKQAELVTLGSNDDGSVPASVAAKVDALQKEIDAIEKTREEVKVKQKALEAERDSKVLTLITSHDGAAFPVSDVPAGFKSSDGPLAPVSGVNIERLKEAREWLGKVVTKGDAPDVAIQVGEGPGYRAHCARDYMQIKTGEKTDVIVHEYGHAIDEHITVGTDKAVRRSYEFLMHRVGDEKKVDLKAKFGCGDPGEMGRKDRFTTVFDEYSAHYVGKDYGTGATEIVSMGLQELYNDPVRFAKNDPEFFKFILGIADGSLR